MGFFFVEGKKADKHLKGLSPDFLQRHGCNVCPLDRVKNATPKMEPSGSAIPEILILGEAPGATEDAKGKQFLGKSGQILRECIPADWLPKLRWSNAVNCRPPDNRTPESVELACCYPRLQADIEKTKPKAIFGFGNIPLVQLTKRTDGINIWRSRKFPVQIGNHACWYYPIQAPDYILYRQDVYGGAEDKTAFEFDLKHAFADIENLPEAKVHTIEQASANVQLLYDLKEIAEALQGTANEKTAGVDIETNCLRPYTANAKILTIAVSSRIGTFAFPVDHKEASWTKLERKQLDVLIKRFLYESKCRKIAHHLPFELEWFGVKYGPGLFYSSPWECSESQAYVLDARRGGLSLDFLCFQHFGINLKAISGLDRTNLDNVPLEQVLKYNGPDARYCRNLFFPQAQRIKEEGLEEVYEHQMRRILSLTLTQMQGIPIDQQVVKSFRKKYEGQAAKAAKEIAQDEAVIEFEQKKGRKFNPSSVPDVNFLMNEVLGLKLEKASRLELDEVEHPVAQKIVAWRQPNKTLSTYVLPVDIEEKDSVVFPDGMMHPIISTTRVITWRSSSDSPNIQNWSKHDERKEVRSQVKHADRNMKIVSFDYAGIQARNVAMESKDKKLVEVYWNNYDIHTDWRERILRHHPKWISKSDLKDKDRLKHYRHIAKNKFVFATFFGAQAYNLSQGLEIPQNVCQGIREEFFDEFPDIEKWHKELDVFYHKHGYITGLSGFRRRAPVSATERINTPIQGDESIIVLDALNRLSEMEDSRYQPMLEVHDDLSFCWPKNEIEKRAEVVVKTMLECPFEWTRIVPIEVEMSVGDDWASTNEVAKFANNSWDGSIKELKF